MAGPEKQGVMKWVHIVVALLLMFVVGNIIPVSETAYTAVINNNEVALYSIFGALVPLTPIGLQVIMIFVGVVYSWIFIGFLWPTLLGLVAMGLSDFITTANMNAVWSGSFGSSVAILLLFSMILFGNVEHVGATKYITRFFLTRKILNGRPIVFALIFFLATYALSLAVNVTPSLLLMWAVLYGILKDLGYQKGEKFTSFMIVGTFLGAISGQATLPFTGSTLAIIEVFNSTVYNITGTQQDLPFLQYVIVGIVFALIGIGTYVLFMKVVCTKEDLAKVANVSTEMFTKEPLPPMNGIQKVNFAAMLIFMFMLLAPDFMSADWPVIGGIIGVLGKMAPAGVAIFITAVMCLIRIDGEPAFNFPVVAKNHINWDVYVMVAGAMYIANSLTHVSTGVTNWMVVLFEPVLGGHSAFIFFAIMLLFGMFVTSFASSLVIGIALMPILVHFGLQSGANIASVTTVLVLLIHYSIILPSASVFAAMLWGNDDWIKPKDVFKHAVFLVIVATAIAFALIPLSNLLF